MTKPNPELAKQLANANRKKASNKLFDPDATKASGFKTNKTRARQARKERDNAAKNPPQTNPAPNITAHGKSVRQPTTIPTSEIEVGDMVQHAGLTWKVANVQPTKKGTLSVTLYRPPGTQKTVRVAPGTNYSAKLLKLKQ